MPAFTGSPSAAAPSWVRDAALVPIAPESLRSRNTVETDVRYVDIMLRSLLELPSVIADYTVGTVIVLVQLAIAGHVSSRAHAK
jgi:hypothetical protein